MDSDPPMLRSLALFGLCALVLGASRPTSPVRTDDEPAAPAPAPSSAPSPLSRVAVVGASASHGYMIGMETGGVPLDLAQALDLLIEVEHEEPFLAASSYLFSDPVRLGEAFVSAAHERRPTLVVAVDFLFWFVYSARQGEARMALLERGLSQLERFDCPLLISEVPDMSEAAGLMIPHAVMPPAKERNAANARIRAWAAERERAHLVPLEGFLEDLREGEEIELRGQTLAEGEGEGLLQWDRLHPTLEGLAWLAVMCADQAERALDEVRADELAFDVERLGQRLRERVAERAARGDD